LRDEEGLLDGPGMKSGITWKDVTYPTGDEREEHADRNVVQLRVPKRTWTDDLADAVGGE